MPKEMANETTMRLIPSVHIMESAVKGRMIASLKIAFVRADILISSGFWVGNGLKFCALRFLSSNR